MPLPLARTRDEALLYLELHPCERCGATSADWKNGLFFDEEDAAARRYWATCPQCAARREFQFRLPERPVMPPPGTAAVFGGAECSELLDAGEWLRLADLSARAAAPVDTDDSGRSLFDAKGRRSLSIAAAAMDEVLKFIPANTDEVPASAFWSAGGLAVRAQEPGRFRRGRLVVVRDTYRDALGAPAI